MSWQNQQNDLCAQQRLRSAWASTQSDQSSLCTLWVAKDPVLLHADCKDWSDWSSAQADLNLCWAHRSFCWFCYLVAQIIFLSIPADDDDALFTPEVIAVIPYAMEVSTLYVGITVFKIVIWGGKLLVLWSEILFYDNASKCYFLMINQRFASPNDNFRFTYPHSNALFHIFFFQNVSFFTKVKRCQRRKTRRQPMKSDVM